MFRIFKFLLTGYWHQCKFEVIHQTEIVRNPRTFLEIDRPITGYCFIQKCSCGKIKTNKVYASN